MWQKSIHFILRIFHDCKSKLSAVKNCCGIILINLSVLKNNNLFKKITFIVKKLKKLLNVVEKFLSKINAPNE
jgi:hypothetical protein